MTLETTVPTLSGRERELAAVAEEEVADFALTWAMENAVSRTPAAAV